jgi:HlyD family secretion protein
MASTVNNKSFLSRHRWLVWIIGIVIAVILLASFMSRDDSVPVRTATVERGDIRSVISTNGKIEPLHNFEAHAPIGTTVKRLFVSEGAHVRQGQLLVELEDSDALSSASKALAQLRSAQANLSSLNAGGTHEEVLTNESQLAKAKTERDTAARNLDSLRRLQQTGAASPGEVREAESQLQRATADVNLLQQKQASRYSQPEVSSVQAQLSEAKSAYAAAEDVLAKLNIRAPFDGVVYSLPVLFGNYVNPGDLVLQEADLSKVVVRSFVDEPDVARLSTGQPIEVTWDAVPGRIWQGAVNSIPSTLKMHGTRNVGETTCVIDNHDYKLLPNVNVNVAIVTKEDKDVLTVPREAIRQDDDRPYVFQVFADRLRRQDVQISIANLTSVEIDSGLQQGAIVALNSTNSKPLSDHLSVKVIH